MCLGKRFSVYQTLYFLFVRIDTRTGIHTIFAIDSFSGRPFISDESPLLIFVCFQLFFIPNNNHQVIASEILCNSSVRSYENSFAMRSDVGINSMSNAGIFKSFVGLFFKRRQVFNSAF